MGQPAAEILSKAVAIAPSLSFSSSQHHRRRHSYHPSTLAGSRDQGEDGLEKKEEQEGREECGGEATTATTTAERADVGGQVHGIGASGGHGHGHGHHHRRGVSASLRGFFRHGPRYGGAAWIELE